MTLENATLENATSVDQCLTAARQLLAARPELLARQGAVIATWRTVGPRRLGPYYALRYRDAGRQQSLYLGSSTAVAAEVGWLLDEAQRPRRQRAAILQARAAARSALRLHKRHWQRELERAGLVLKGFEIRGWTALGDAPSPVESAAPGGTAPRQQSAS